VFTLGDSTQGISCTATSKTEGAWTVTVSGKTATVKPSGDQAPVDNAGIATPLEVKMTLDAATFKCRLPEDGIDPVSGVMGAEGAMSASVFTVDFNGANGRKAGGPVDNRHSVYKYKCLQHNIVTSGAEFCDASYQINMCAVSVDAIKSYVSSVGLEKADGFKLLMQGGVVYNPNATDAAVAGEMRAQMKARCDGAHNAACSSVGDYSSTTTRLDLISSEAVQSICCSHSPETHQRNEAGLGNLATCLKDYDCDGIPAGAATQMSDAAVATAEDVCCSYCHDFYGGVACVDAQGRSPGTELASVQAYCKDTIKCSEMPPCKGYSFGGKGVQIPDVIPAEGLVVATLGGDGVNHLVKLSRVALAA